MVATHPQHPAALHARFLPILPRIERHGQVYFRDVKCPMHKADCIAEMIALCWKWFVRLADQGKDASHFPMALARYAAWAVQSGRRVCGQEPAQDALSPRAQMLHDFAVESLPASPRTSREHLYGTDGGQRRQDEWEERLTDNTTTPPDQQAMFRIDFAAWLQTLTPRERKIIRRMARNERTSDLAKLFQLSPGRISQLRWEFREDWRRFGGDDLLAPRRRIGRGRKRGRP